MTKGDCDSVFDEGLNVISGEVKVGSQEHFYMEPQSCIVIPTGEDQELEIISSTQNPTGIQVRSNALECCVIFIIFTKIKLTLFNVYFS